MFLRVHHKNPMHIVFVLCLPHLSYPEANLQPQITLHEEYPPRSVRSTGGVAIFNLLDCIVRIEFILSCPSPTNEPPKRILKSAVAGFGEI